MADITITNIPAETHEKLQSLAALKGVSAEAFALELLKEALVTHEGELSQMMRLELQLHGSKESGSDE